VEERLSKQWLATRADRGWPGSRPPASAPQLAARLLLGVGGRARLVVARLVVFRAVAIRCRTTLSHCNGRCAAAHGDRAKEEWQSQLRQ
jgi:hypothetical protein